MPNKNTIFFQRSTAYTDHIPSNSPLPKFNNFTSLDHLTTLFTLLQTCEISYQVDHKSMRRMQYDRLTQQQLGFLF